MNVNSPRQARSRATMERFVAAALDLVELKRWDEISVNELAAAAKSSVGAFYARFGDKSTMLQLLDDRYVEMLFTVFEEFSVHPPQTLALDARLLIDRLVALHLQRRGLIRTLVLTARGTTEPAFTRNTQRLNRSLPQVLSRLSQCSDLPTGCDKRHLTQALLFTYSAMREQILFPEALPGRVNRSRRELTHSLSAAFCGTLDALVAL